MKINNIKDSIEYFKKINHYGTDKEPYYLRYNLEEGTISIEWYQAILEKVKKYKPKRVIDIGSNVNLYGYLFANEGIEYIGVDLDTSGCKHIETDNIKFIKANYYDVKEQFKNDIIISCLCVGYLIPIKDVLGKVLIVNGYIKSKKGFKCTAKEIILNKSYTVYKHTCPQGKVYIGQTKQEPKVRWCSGNGYKNNECFYSVIKKYGWCNIKHEILFTNLTKDDADRIEKDLIKQFKSNEKEYGYNIENGGGKGKIITQETRKKLSEANKGKKIKK
jgi:hypothetical protein